jgi:hypothetical protein
MKSRNLDSENVIKNEVEAARHSPLAMHHSPIRSWLKEPLLHLFVLGLAVFGLHAVLERGSSPAPDDPYLVEVTSADIEWFRTMWKKRMGREPTVEDLRAQVNQLIRESILEREAVEMGLDKDDLVVRRRLAQKMEFLFKDLSALAEPSDEDLHQYFEENQSQYKTPERVTFFQVFFNADRRGVEGAERAAKALLESLEAGGGSPASANELGDPSMLPAHCEKCDAREIQGRFGAEFYETVKTLQPGSWRGPVSSGYGLHAVYVHQRSESRLPDFEEIKDRLEADWISAKQRADSRKAYQELRSRYRVLLEGMPYDLDMDGAEKEE